MNLDYLQNMYVETVIFELHTMYVLVVCTHINSARVCKGTAIPWIWRRRVGISNLWTDASANDTENEEELVHGGMARCAHALPAPPQGIWRNEKQLLVLESGIESSLQSGA